jgi:hypothetical protein
MLIVNFIIILIMFIGLICTLAHRLHGTLVILAAASIYAIAIGMSEFYSWVVAGLFMLTFIAEIGARWLRIILTRHYEVSRLYSVNAVVCNLGGIIVTDALLGPLAGTIIWEALVGKTLFPHLDSIGRVLLLLILAAVLRFICGLAMIIIVINYIMYTG